MLGRVTPGGGRIRVRVNSQRRLRRLMRILAAIGLEPQVTEEKRAEPSPDFAWGPVPRGDGPAREWEKNWLDQAVAALNFRTPRQAAHGEVADTFRVEALLRQLEYQAGLATRARRTRHRRCLAASRARLRSVTPRSTCSTATPTFVIPTGLRPYVRAQRLLHADYSGDRPTSDTSSGCRRCSTGIKSNAPRWEPITGNAGAVRPPRPRRWPPPGRSGRGHRGCPPTSASRHGPHRRPGEDLLEFFETVGTAAVLGRAGAFPGDARRVGLAGLGHGVGLDEEFVLPAVAEVVFVADPGPDPDHVGQARLRLVRESELAVRSGP